jgi:hypothetical protein
MNLSLLITRCSYLGLYYCCFLAVRINANAIIISSSSSSSSVEQINDNNNYKDRMMMVGGGPDKHRCFGDAGYEWCASASKCIQPFEESCPIEGPVLDFIGPQTIVCGSNNDNDDYYGGKCILHSDECSFTAIDKSTGEPASWTIGGKYLGNLNGAYIIYNNCTATCNGCSSITVGGDWDDDTSTTYDKDENKDDDDNDYYATTTTFAGPLDFECNNGSCNIINSDNDDCKISAGGTNLTAHLSFVRGLKGSFSITNEKCNISCRSCSAIPSTEIYDFDCKGRGKCCDTYDGDFYCPELGQCVDSKKKSCPISTNTTTYSGPTQLTCKEGRCNNFAPTSSGCGLVTSGNQTLDGRLFISNLEGDYLVPQGCIASCEGCSPTQGSGDLPNGIVLAPGPVIFPLPNGGSRRQLRGALN